MNNYEISQEDYHENIGDLEKYKKSDKKENKEKTESLVKRLSKGEKLAPVKRNKFTK